MRSRSRDMLARDVAERQRRPQCDAGAGIIAAHDARHVVAGGIEACDRLAMLIKCARMFVGPDACMGRAAMAQRYNKAEQRRQGRRFDRDLGR